ncbi:FAA hydrolase family protein [bacterium]|nr:MAG: FAA hydrolase family protein [bacterium]
MPVVQFQAQQSQLRVNTIYCIGRNYAEHAKELNNPVPTKPMVFLKPNAAIETENQTVKLPKESNDVHHEVELVLLIGKKGTSIHRDQAWEYISGVGIGIDFTARDIQQKAKDKGHPWTLAKGFDTFAPVSEFIPISKIDTAKSFDLKFWVNNELKQHGTTSDMIFSVPELVEYISGFSTIHEGDLIFTGTPEGVGKVSSGDSLKASLNNGLTELTLRVE